ncbi:MAG: hypothetical protein ABW019_07510 [Chitinophagaceae bacterium]
MITGKMIFFAVSIFFYSLTVSGQDGPPPPAAMPADSNIILVDKIIDVTRHKEYFMNYCKEKTESHAQKNNWTAEKTKTILGSINFEYYRSTIYNSYAFYTARQLTGLLDALTLLYRGKPDHLVMILTNSMMQFNLDVFVENIIEGKYVRSH